MLHVLSPLDKHKPVSGHSDDQGHKFVPTSIHRNVNICEGVAVTVQEFFTSAVGEYLWSALRFGRFNPQGSISIRP
jgi:hypothetical protein